MKTYFDALSKEISTLLKKEYPRDLILKAHSMMHMIDDSQISVLEELIKQSNDEDMHTVGKYKGRTTVYNLWHTTRIEDIVVNEIILNESQLFSKAWQAKIKSSITHTGNSLTKEEVLAFSKPISIQDLLDYRSAVALKTRNMLMTLTVEDLNRRFNEDDYLYLIEKGSVTEDQKWLISYWTGSDLRRLLKTPITKHHMMHFNQSFRNIKK